MKVILKNVVLDGRERNVVIDGNVFSNIDAPGDTASDKCIDCKGKAIVPAMYNAHTHASMMPMRGLGEDLPLQTWLTGYIWPFEDKMTAEDIRQGSALACREMISSGSVFFNDMYFEIEQTIDEVVSRGMRACIGITVMENHSKAVLDSKMDFIRNFRDTSGLVQLAMAPHSVYTVGKERLVMSAKVARDNGLKIHIHISETRKEVDDCLSEHGMTPVRYLDSIGLLGPDVIAAHCVHVDREEWDILAERGVHVCHCPCSNMKLGSGRFPYEMALESGAKVCLGTDSASSNNNLDMREEMKFAALLAKSAGNPELLPASTVMQWACENGASAFGLKAGKIEEGYLADALLLDLENVRMKPANDIVSSWVYAADSSCIAAVICDGKFIYENKNC